MYSIETLIKTIETYKPELTKEDDFDSFWKTTQEESAQVPLQPILTEMDYPIDQVIIQSDKSIIVYPFSGHDAPGIISHVDGTILYIKENL
ncbi:acetylxylan esterase [Neobacillus sp. NPDC058068]|uniref:acetylxylan esterase n=1 Tax=Neobacillus sp. NPDC058068 TaxID=3346325 RepID=UPI0036D7DCE4